MYKLPERFEPLFRSSPYLEPMWYLMRLMHSDKYKNKNRVYSN